MSHDPSRRAFLHGTARATLVMPAALGTTISTAALLAGCSREPAVAAGFRVLRAHDLPMLRRLLPAVIGDAAGGEEATTRLVASYDRLLADTSPEIRAVFLPLLDLLSMGITRGPLFGQWRGWEHADAADAAACLDRWAASRTGFLRGAYNGFNATATMAWYLDPAHHAAAGYPGPPRKVVA